MGNGRTERLETRVTPETQSKLVDLSRAWGGLRPMSKTATIEEAIDRVWRSEHAARTEKRRGRH